MSQARHSGSAPTEGRLRCPATGTTIAVALVSFEGQQHSASALPELVETAALERGRILTRQLERNAERRVATMLTLSGLPGGKTHETYDWASARATWPAASAGRHHGTSVPVRCHRPLLPT